MLTGNVTTDTGGNALLDMLNAERLMTFSLEHHLLKNSQMYQVQTNRLYVC